MASENFRSAISPNISNGFTPQKCKIPNICKPPYGFTTPRGYIHPSTLPPDLGIILSPNHFVYPSAFSSVLSYLRDRLTVVFHRIISGFEPQPMKGSHG